MKFKLRNLLNFLLGPQPVTPVRAKPRYACPFYGFSRISAESFMLDQAGNQCGLLTDEFFPCQMELAGQTPDWETCPLNSEVNKFAVRKIRNNLTVFPEELRPKRAKAWRGMPFCQWFSYVMGDGVKRPPKNP